MKYTLLLIIGFLASCALLKGDKSASNTFSVDLSELPIDERSKLQSNFDLQKLDATRGEIEMSKTAFENNVQYFLERAVLNKEIEAMEFYLVQSRPRLKYWEHIIGQLPDYVNYGYKYDGYTDTKKEKDKQLAYLAYRTDRNPQNILKIWEASKKLLFAAVSKEKFQALQLEDYVETLLLSHDYLTQLKEYDNQMHEIYSQVQQEDAIEDIFGRTSNQFSIYEGVICPEILEKYRGANGMVMNDFGEFTDVLWFHSFWVRRYHEGNTAAVHKILKELEAHYKI